MNSTRFWRYSCNSIKNSWSSIKYP